MRKWPAALRPSSLRKPRVAWTTKGRPALFARIRKWPAALRASSLQARSQEGEP
jgi:hypothetical protein